MLSKGTNCMSSLALKLNNKEAIAFFQFQTQNITVCHSHQQNFMSFCIKYIAILIILCLTWYPNSFCRPAAARMSYEKSVLPSRYLAMTDSGFNSTSNGSLGYSFCHNCFASCINFFLVFSFPSKEWSTITPSSNCQQK